MASEAQARQREIEKRAAEIRRAAPQPVEDPRERRAFCLRMAVESYKGWTLAEIIEAARAFETYINGAGGPHEWQEYNEHHNSCHFPGCTAEESEHPTR